jgi:RNA polymerase sigma factor (sigma-70 family)
MNKKNIIEVGSSNFQTLILENRDYGHRMARKILLSFGAHLHDDDLLSAADLALCEAASRYRPVPKASFTTYLYYFIKGEIIRSLKENSRITGRQAVVIQHKSDMESEYLEDKASLEDVQEMHNQNDCPEYATYQSQLRHICHAVLSKLSMTEKTVIIESHIKEENMDMLSKRMGYSRCHLFAIRKTAEEKMRIHFDEANFDMAA